MIAERWIGGSSPLPFSVLLSIRSQLTDRFAISILTALAVATSVALAMSVEVASRSLQEQLRTTTQALLGSASLSISAGQVGVPEEALDQVAQVPGVLGASPLIRRSFRVASGPEQGRALHVIGLDLLGESDVRRYEISRAGVIVRDAVRLLALPDSVVVSEAFAARLGIGDGDRLALTLEGRPVDLVVRGVLGGEVAEAFGGQIAAMDIFALQQVVGMEGRFERIDVALETDAPVDEVAQRIQAAIGPGLSVSRDAERESFGLALLRTYQRALWAIVLVALATSSLLTYAVSSMSIDRRLDELSLLRAAGMEGERVGRAVLADAFVIAVAGTALGASAAPFVTRAVFGVLSVASRVLSGMELSDAGLAPATVAIGLAVGVVGVVGAAVPASRRAARIGPFELIDLGRGSIRRERTRSRAIGFALAGAALLAFAWLESPAPSALRVIAGVVGGVALSAGLGHRLIDRGANPYGWLSRSIPRIGFLIGSTLRDRPVETALTISAWATIAAGLITGVTAIRSYTGSIDGYYYGLYGEDAVMLLAGDPFGTKGLEAISQETLEALRESGLVEEIAAVRRVEVSVLGRRVHATSFATDAISRRGRLGSATTKPQEAQAALKEGHLAMSESLAKTLGVRLGDRVTVQSTDGARTLRVGALFSGTSGPTGSLHLDEAAFEAVFPQSEEGYFMAALWVAPPEEESVEVLRRIETSQPLFFLRGREARRFVARSAEKYRALLMVPIALVCGLGVVSLLSLLFGATRSRQKEFALLRAAGATRANVVAIITLSGGLIGTLGALIGIAISVLWSSVICEFLSESIGWKIEPFLASDVAAWVCAAAGVLAMLGSLLPALLTTRTRDLLSAPTP